MVADRCTNTVLVNQGGIRYIWWFEFLINYRVLVIRRSHLFSVNWIFFVWDTVTHRSRINEMYISLLISSVKQGFEQFVSHRRSHKYNSNHNWSIFKLVNHANGQRPQKLTPPHFICWERLSETGRETIRRKNWSKNWKFGNRYQKNLKIMNQRLPYIIEDL